MEPGGPGGPGLLPAGTEWLRGLKEFKNLDKRARVLVASGFLSSQDMAKPPKQEGAMGLINKPYRLTELQHRIKAVLAGGSGF